MSGILTGGCDRQPHSDVEAVVDLYFYKKRLSVNRKHQVVAIAVAGVGLCAMGYAAYHMKKDSADGRGLMWKVATLAAARSPLEG